METLGVSNCKEDHQCTRLDRLYKCERGRCWNITSAYSCEWDPEDQEPAVNCAKKRNCVELDGQYSCSEGLCSRIHAWKCQRRCSGINPTGKNVVIMSGERFLLANCRRVVSSSGETVWTADSMNVQSPVQQTLLMSCTGLDATDPSGVRAIDCINGSLVESESLKTISNYTSVMRVFNTLAVHPKLDPRGRWLPREEDITIFNKSRLMINHEGCVNTLQGECKDFYDLTSNDGRNSTSPSRFPCYYSPGNSEFVVQRYDPLKTRWLFLIGFLIPAGLLIFSCGVLFTCSRILTVDNDGRMAIDCCKERPKKERAQMQLTTSGTLMGYSDEIQGDPL